MNAVILGYGVVGKGIEILANSLEDINIKYVYVRKEYIWWHDLLGIARILR